MSLDDDKRTYVQDIPKDQLERIRGEILGNVEQRREEAHEAFSDLTKYMGIILSGGAIAILSFIGSRKDQAIPTLAILSFAAFALGILSFAFFLHRHSQLHAARWDFYAVLAQKFFLRDASLNEVLDASTQLQRPWLYRLLFWIPFVCVALGFILGTLAALRINV